MNYYYSAQGDTLDIICYRYYGSQSVAVEEIMNANRHLADLGVVLPIGTKIMLPAIEKTAENKRVALW
jgi:phage tail protein X